MSTTANYPGIPGLVATSEGNIYMNGRPVKQYTRRNGYLQINITVDGKHKNLYAHRVCAGALCENPNGLSQVNHKNGIKHDNRAENLEWVTQSRNISHSRETGLIDSKGEKHWKAILTDSDVMHIVAMHKTGLVSMAQIASVFGIKRGSARDICRGKLWRHITGILY